ncbi:MAG: DnaB-like helicase N-terminal domain-containing protein [Candidatus Didemnitutus sp.]|nr:DnaB-like helicase N-terminal domain-containing protein [Candidatus Didemnitutus sp.]
MSDFDDFDPFAATTAKPPTRATATIVPPKPPAPIPARAPARSTARESTPTTREMPWSEEAEQHVIACCLLDGGLALKRARDARLTPQSFFSAANRLIFSSITKLADEGKPVTIEVLVEELRASRSLDAVGGFSYLMGCTSRIPTAAHAGYFIGKVREKEKLRDFIRAGTTIVEQSYTFTGGLDEFATEIGTRWASVLKDTASAAIPPARSLIDFPYPDAGDPNILLGSDDYLGRGGGMLFVSHGGAGKSSFIYDGALTWALGEPLFGIRANGKLKILIIQAEDSERYVGKIAQSFAYKHSLSTAQRDHLRTHVVIIHLKGVTGAAFLSQLSNLVDEHLPDLVILNPIYLYAEGDITRSEFAQPFLVGLDAINKDARFGYIIVHHTGKPSQKNPSGKRAELQDWETIYMGFGSSYFANWPRCSALLEPRGKEHGAYWLRLGKAGGNAGVTRLVAQGAGQRLEPCTKIGVRYCRDTMDVKGKPRPVIYWELDETAEEEAAQEPKDFQKRKRGGGGGKHNIDEVLACFSKGEANAQPLLSAVRKAVETLGMKRGTFMDYRQDFFNSGQIKKDDLSRYYRP